MRLVAAGVDHRTAPLQVRERAAAAIGEPAQLLRYLVGHAGLRGAALLTTCNRTEFYLTCPEAAAAEAAPRLARYLDPGGEVGLAERMVTRYDSDAALHLLRVAAGLESMLVGEAQVLGQVRDAHRAAREAGTLDARLDFVLRRAVSVGKRVRRETALGREAGSLSDAALDCAAEVLGGVTGRSALLVGAGTMNRLAARKLERLGSPVYCVSRSTGAGALARAHGGTAIAPDEIIEVAPDIDFVLTSTSSRERVLSRTMVSAMQQARGERALCIVDLAVPRDVEPEVGAIEGVTLLDIDSLGARVEHAGAGRDQDVRDAEALVESELERTTRALDERDSIAPTIAALQQRAEQLRRDELERTLRRTPELDQHTRERIDAMTQSLMRKLLHAPIARLRESDGDPALALTIREAFDLEA